MRSSPNINTLKKKACNIPSIADPPCPLSQTRSKSLYWFYKHTAWYQLAHGKKLVTQCGIMFCVIKYRRMSIHSIWILDEQTETSQYIVVHILSYWLISICSWNPPICTKSSAASKITPYFSSYQCTNFIICYGMIGHVVKTLVSWRNHTNSKSILRICQRRREFDQRRRFLKYLSIFTTNPHILSSRPVLSSWTHIPSTSQRILPPTRRCKSLFGNRQDFLPSLPKIYHQMQCIPFMCSSTHFENIQHICNHMEQLLLANHIRFAQCLCCFCVFFTTSNKTFRLAFYPPTNLFSSNDYTVIWIILPLLCLKIFMLKQPKWNNVELLRQQKNNK